MNHEELAIDPHRLDEEWLNQPILFARACEKVEDATRSRDTARQELDSVLSTTQVAIRGGEPKDYKVPKFTEGVIQALIDADPYVIKAKKHLTTMSLHLESAKNDLRAVEMKKKSLEGMVQLFIAQYFSVPKEGKTIEGGKRFEEQIQENITEEHRENLKKSKRNRFSKNPVTTKEERAERTDEEKLAAMDPELRKEVEGHIKNSARRKRRKRS
jgi:hypothetical protein